MKNSYLPPTPTTHTEGDFGLVLVTIGDKVDTFAHNISVGEWHLEVWESATNELKVLLKDGVNGTVVARRVFADSETQHHDSERWLNDTIQYPNPFAGILSERVWCH